MAWLAYRRRRAQTAGISLSLVPPSSSEAAALHLFYLQSTTDHKASQELLPMAETKLEKTLTMYPQERK